MPRHSNGSSEAARTRSPSACSTAAGPGRPTRRSPSTSAASRRWPTSRPRSGDLGLARAYVTGEIEVEGDLYTALQTLSALDFDLPLRERLQAAARARRRSSCCAARPRRAQEVRLSRPAALQGPRPAGDQPPLRRVQQLLRVDPRPVDGLHLRGLPDARRRRWRRRSSPSSTWSRASSALRPGMRLLDVGCGWGGMVMHAAQHYGVRALGVTLSRQQAEWAQKAIAEAGLTELAEVRHLDYRDVAESGLRRGQLDRPDRAHRTVATGRRTSGSSSASCARAAGCSTTASRVPDDHRRGEGRLVHPPLRLPRRRADRGRPHRLDHAGRRASRSGTRRTCASTTR